ncbi:hypothetical protein [Plesiomonas shigelloides]|uniref:hypothetical protein n=1 Tax=Plesiomonas shigelloides TaxID=703 RepID=UPI00131C30BF|nr:hypothetical protein [Plesiomonas shigelloides]
MSFTIISELRDSSCRSSISWKMLREYAGAPIESDCVSIESAKQSSPLVAAHNAPSRLKSAAESAQFGLLRADLDQCEQGLSPEIIAAKLRSAGLYAFIIYSTLSHTSASPRYRVLVEIAQAIKYETWAMLQLALAEFLNSDPCVNKPSQFMILPVVTHKTALNYCYLLGMGKALAPEHRFWIKAQSRAGEYQAKANNTLSHIKNNRYPMAKIQFKEHLIGKQQSVINAINESFSWPELLTQYGYKRKGLNAWLAPESKSGIAGAYLLVSDTDGKERLYSHHQSDPCYGRLVDKCDLIAIRSSNADHLATIREFAIKHLPAMPRYNSYKLGNVKCNKYQGNIGTQSGGVIQ